jgi:hypothetical protein
MLKVLDAAKVEPAILPWLVHFVSSFFELEF